MQLGLVGGQQKHYYVLPNLVWYFTNKMTAMLTPGYAPIEQYANLNKPNPSTDLYAICV